MNKLIMNTIVRILKTITMFTVMKRLTFGDNDILMIKDDVGNEYTIAVLQTIKIPGTDIVPNTVNEFMRLNDREY